VLSQHSRNVVPALQESALSCWGSALSAAVIWCEEDDLMTAGGFSTRRAPPGFAAAPGRCIPRPRGGLDPARAPAGADPGTGQTRLADHAFFYGESKLYGATEELGQECPPLPRRATSLATMRVRVPGWRAGCSRARIRRGPSQCRPPGTCELDVGACGQSPGHRHIPLLSRPAQPGGFRQPAVGQDPPRRPSPTGQPAAETARRECRDATGRGMDHVPVSTAPPEGWATGIRMRGYKPQ
jgi:hypothetical protein